MKVAILGCGPAGLVAAYAAESAGHNVEIFSKPRQSEMFGAQYLHEPIPGISPGSSITISYQLRGTIEQYRRKVYGDEYNGSVSPGSLPPGHRAWNIRLTYNSLWHMYGKAVCPAMICPSWLREEKPNAKFDAVISTVPAPLLCGDTRHTFDSQAIWAFGDAPSRGQRIWHDIPDGTVICNGEPDPTWYRASKIFGYSTLEWSQNGLKPQYIPVAEAKKPLKTTCNCNPSIHRVGRYGAWKKGYLVHHAFADVISFLQKS